jgi:RNA polymerase sigma factor (sigma-70 family)
VFRPSETSVAADERNWSFAITSPFDSNSGLLPPRATKHSIFLSDFWVGGCYTVVMTEDRELLRRYAETGCEDAFTEVVRRHLDLVYSAALRQVNGDAHLAQDVVQSVFTDCARKAASLSRRNVLTGWLYTSVHFAATKAVRTIQRRRTREREASIMHGLLDGRCSSDSNWEELLPLLDRAMHELKASDRDLILMRYFENRRLADLGIQLGLSEEAARKRVDRALERLRAVLGKQGVPMKSSLSALLSANAVQLAPAGLSGTLASAAVASAPGGSLSTLVALKVMIIANMKTAGVAVMVTLVALPLYLQHRSIQRLRKENALAREMVANATPAAPSTPPQAADAVELARLRSEHDELLRLRNEVSLLRQQLADAAAKRKSQVARAPQMLEPLEPVQLFVANADATIPAGETLAFGGWTTAPGKRTMMFVRPRIVESAGVGRVASILLESQFIEVTEETLSKVSSELNLTELDEIKADGRASSSQVLFTAEQAGVLLKAFQSTGGADVLAAPRVQTVEGNPATVSVSEKKTIAGREHVLGPSIELEPRISADGSSVNLTVSARLKKATALTASSP